MKGRVDYDFGPVLVSGRLRWSNDSFAHSGQSWNKRAYISAPLDFLPSPKDVTLKAYATGGNFWVANARAYGIPNNDYWYWQLGLVTSVWGLDFTLAYTDTNIDVAGCGYTPYCSGRVFLSLTKVF